MVRLIRLGVKLGIVGGALHLSREVGLWNDNEYTETLYKDMYQTLSPMLKEVTEDIPMPEIPKAGELAYNGKQLWNRGVMATAQFLIDIPQNTKELVNDSVNFISSQFESSSTSNQP